ncbi:LOW QUALITY PROTEIN: uncharacterized protein LOC132786879 [Drosophila nasuta]|uniref:Cilia- and flagella-associated protein 263 n=1 Tax=Drosophila albomicans TaxID=7291 RepID=A0A6P8XD10_DROAB|nr:uncharacterized protein LOC117563432 [Drosophila albomicans]XP_060649575.1 LOW QUALITY PROTEIN: uncharacterized protein LOC132786879 [Drosophila nasuta]
MHSASEAAFSTRSDIKSTTNTQLNVNAKRSVHTINEDQYPELDIMSIAYKFYLDEFAHLPDDERRSRLHSLDALEMLQTIETVQKELAIYKLENHIMVDFLEKNDPKLLVGLRHRRTSILKKLHSKSKIPQDNLQHSSRHSSSKRSISMSIHMASSTVGERRKPMEYKLNYKAKAELAEKATSEVEKRVTDIERNASVEVKQLRAKIEELRYRSEETIETEKNFMLHFLRDDNDKAFLESATERQIERKLRKFTANWFKNARALLGTMRLTIVSLQETCQQHRADLITKADLSGILTAVDFEKLIIKRNELINELEEKNTHMAGLKGITGKTSLAMTEEKQAMMNLETEMRNVLNRTEEITRTISKLEKEVAIVQANNDKDNVILSELRGQLDEFEAPSVTEYIEKKEEALYLEKEEKMLQRKIYILNMKLNNVMRRCRYRDE